MRNILFCCEFDSKQNMFQLLSIGKTSDDFKSDSNMHYAMYAYETYGDATRDNSFQDLIALGKDLENETTDF
jgi:hypothetical protein